MTRRRITTSGFTLLELVLVLVIAALLAAMAAPSLADFARGRAVADTAARFAASANFARAQALADGQVYRLSMDTDAGRFWVTHDDGSGNNFVATDSPDALPYTIPSMLQMQTEAPLVDNVHVIEFDPQGRVDPGTVRFTDAWGNAVEVTCDSPLGSYHVSTGPDALRGQR